MITEPTTLHITAFQPQDQAEVKALILAGLADHWGELDPTRNPDLNDIASTYTGATFLVGRLAGRIVASGALVPRPGGEAEIVRMSVDRSLRQQGLGRQMLAALLRQAQAAGCRRIILETTATWQGVIDFYLRCGFRITHYQGEDVYFALDLS